MAKRGRGSERKAAAFEKLMENHHIDFEGRILPDRWGSYTELFHEIRRIGRIRPEDFVEMFQADDEYVVTIRVKAFNVMEKAWNCLRNLDSEQKWRKEVEYPAFESFDEEVVCHNCYKRRWKPKFEAKPRDGAEADRLERRRRRRVLCKCTPIERAVNHVGDNHCKIFSGKPDTSFHHEDLRDSVKKTVRLQRPDGIIGLQQTPTLRQYLPTLQTRYSPFEKDNVVYPFLVVEAKQAENSEASFGSIRRQTAFVVRTCLRLQQNLQQETNLPHQSLVWSFASMGELWRLSAAVPNDDGAQIFDLWQGSVLFPEGALQLLLIIDYLCDWACDIYRQSILSCLVGGRQNLLHARLTPSGTDASSQISAADLASLREMSLSWRSSLVPEQRIPTSVLRSDDRLPRFSGIIPLIQTDTNQPTELEDSHNWLRWLKSEHRLPRWTEKATIRHSNHINFSFVDVILPEEPVALRNFLQSCIPTVPIEDAAAKVLTAMQDDKITFTMPAGFGNSADGAQDETGSTVRVLLFFTSTFRFKDWQLARVLLCITCGESSMKELANIAGGPQPAVLDPARFSEEQFFQALNWSRNIGGPHSAALTLNRCKLCLRLVRSRTGAVEFQWTRLPPSMAGGLAADEITRMAYVFQTQGVQGSEFLQPFVKGQSHSYIVPAAGSWSSTRATLQMPNFRSRGILLRKAGRAQQTTPMFCFMIMDEEIDFRDEIMLGDLLQEARGANEVYGLVEREGADYEPAILDRWVQILKGELASDTQLE